MTRRAIKASDALQVERDAIMIALLQQILAELQKGKDK